jgi:hypothetical protein
MADTLLEAHRIATVARDQGRAALSGNEIRIIGRLYTGALARARTDNPASGTTVPGGHARTLGARFGACREVILRFTTNLAVGFTSNISVMRSPLRVHAGCVSRPRRVQRRMCLTG